MKTVAVLGASADRSKFGNKAVRAFALKGFKVFPVHPKASEIETLPCYPNLASLPVRPSLVSVYLPPNVLVSLIPEISASGPDEVWLNPGTTSDEVLSACRQAGLSIVEHCSLLALGVVPENF